VNITELTDELDRQAVDGPDLTELRAAVEIRFAARQRRRRTVALLAAAAAVVALVGGIGLGVSMFRSDGSAPAGPPPVVPVPQVPLPADTQLIRQQLPEVSSPVYVPRPTGLQQTLWWATSHRLTVVYFATDGHYRSPDPAARLAGYAITDAEADPLNVDGEQTTGTTGTTTVDGRTVGVVTAPAGAIDALGFPAERRLTWQLGDGRWIHVWFENGSDQALVAFAVGVVERPTPLIRTIGIGVGLPGIPDDFSVNSTALDGSTPTSVSLCPPGVDPYSFAGISEGSGSSSAAGPTTDSTTNSGGRTDDANPGSRCLLAVVAAASLDQVRRQAALSPMTYDGRQVEIDNAGGLAATELGNGLIAMVSAPATAHLSSADLAAAVLSVRASPSITVVPGGDWTSSAAVGTTSAAASAAGPEPQTVVRSTSFASIGRGDAGDGASTASTSVAPSPRAGRTG
jgi:hypothetical protein